MDKVLPTSIHMTANLHDIKQASKLANKQAAILFGQPRLGFGSYIDEVGLGHKGLCSQNSFCVPSYLGQFAKRVQKKNN